MNCPECGAELHLRGKTVTGVNEIPITRTRSEVYTCLNNKCRYFEKGLLYDPETKRLRPSVSST